MAGLFSFQPVICFLKEIAERNPLKEILAGTLDFFAGALYNINL